MNKEYQGGSTLFEESLTTPVRREERISTLAKKAELERSSVVDTDEPVIS